jgi:hypothetical protein
MSLLVHRPPQIVGLPVDFDEHLVKVPLVPRAGPPAAQAIGVGLPELAAPLVDGVIGDVHPAVGHHLLHVAQA